MFQRNILSPMFSPENGNNIFLQNVGIYLQVYMVSQPRWIMFQFWWFACMKCYVTNVLLFSEA
jgi:hypothetical protein